MPNEILDPLQPLYIIGEQGVHRLKFEFCGPVAGLGAALSRGLPQRVLHPFTVNDQPVTLAIEGDTAFVGVQLKEIVLSTHFAVRNNALVPMFQANQNHVTLAPNWVPPADMKLIFGVVAKQDPHGYRFEQAHLFAQQLSNPVGFHLLPLPNVFEDSRVCMGNDIQTHLPPQATLHKIVENALHHFNSAPWNADLISGATNAKEMFRFGLAEGNPTLPPTAAWPTLSRRVNHPSLANLI